MFTGIIESIAKVHALTQSSLILERPAMFDDIRIGSSVAVSGVCLSVTAFDANTMTFDVIPTTLNKSTLGSLSVGDRVNLERALPANGRLDGHIVLGHCEGVGTVGATQPGHRVPDIEKGNEHWLLTIDIPSDLAQFIVPHGSITIDGVSLTIAQTKENQCSVALIPHTVQNTTLDSLEVGNSVNIETDVIGRYVMSRGLSVII